jgi:hypothetical protein
MRRRKTITGDWSSLLTGSPQLFGSSMLAPLLLADVFSLRVTNLSGQELT